VGWPLFSFFFGAVTRVARPRAAGVREARSPGFEIVRLPGHEGCNRAGARISRRVRRGRRAPQEFFCSLLQGVSTRCGSPGSMNRGPLTTYFG
jgi:hypothetical protein